MIQDIAPHNYDNAYAHRRPPCAGDVLLCYRGNRALLRVSEAGIEYPVLSSAEAADPDFVSGLMFLFLIDGQAYFLAEELPSREAEGYTWEPIARFRDRMPSWRSFAGITGAQLYRFRDDHHFCGRCGSRMEPSGTERAYCCPNCGETVYPKISPAVIVGITDGERLLMSRYAGRPFKRYSLIAGYTEIGETLEETVHREVMEEVGLRVKNLRYFGCQPWSFSDSLLMGFFADLDGSPEILLDETELAEARWFAREEIPPAENQVSLTSTMIETFRVRGI